MWKSLNGCYGIKLALDTVALPPLDRQFRSLKSVFLLECVKDQGHVCIEDHFNVCMCECVSIRIYEGGGIKKQFLNTMPRVCIGVVYRLGR